MRHIRFLAPMLWLTVLVSLAQAQIPIVKVTASLYDVRGPHYPTNTLSNDETRWSAKGKGQWIQYELAPGLWRLSSATLRWYTPVARDAFFQIQTSRNGSTWRTVFNGSSRDDAASSGINTFLYHLFPSYWARYVRIVGQGNSRDLWNSLEFASFSGYPMTVLYEHPSLFFAIDVTPPEGCPYPDEEMWDPCGYWEREYLSDFETNITVLLPANTPMQYVTSLDTHGSLFDDDPRMPPACLALFWADEEPVPFSVTLLSGSKRLPLLRESSPGPSYAVYPLPDVSRFPIGTDDDGAPAYRFEIEAHVDAQLDEVAVLADCLMPTGREYAATVQASSFQNLINVPGNTLDGNPKTRWSAEGDGQWIAYQVMGNTYSRVGIRWHAGATRTAYFDIEMSANGGYAWFPILTGARSRRQSGMEWYTFPPTLGNAIRIVGHGNSANAWNSILEVQFGNPAVNMASQ